VPVAEANRVPDASASIRAGFPQIDPARLGVFHL
jgi:hypothetical protein